MNIPIEKYLPIAMIVLAAGASIIYFYNGDIRKGVYWLAAAVLNISVTF